MQNVTPSELYPRNLPETNGFRDYVGSLGISDNHHVVFYDRSPTGFLASSRAWWLFQVKIFNVLFLFVYFI